jgi:hypothetical protein
MAAVAGFSALCAKEVPLRSTGGETALLRSRN